MIILLIIICQSFILRSNKIYACLSLQLLPLLEFRLTGQLHAQFTEGKYIHRRQHNRSMCLAAFQLWKLLQGKTCFWIRSSTDGKGNHGLIHMKTRILTSKIICLQFLNASDDRFRQAPSTHSEEGQRKHQADQKSYL